LGASGVELLLPHAASAAAARIQASFDMRGV
jgi:hypothetical protein